VNDASPGREDLSKVTVLVPAFNEADDIDACLEQILAQDMDPTAMEIVVVDGASTDSTRAVAEASLRSSRFPWTIVENAKRTTPTSLNAGLAAASGEVVCRVDARSLIPDDYVRRCARVLSERPEVAVVGGSQVAAARPGAGVVARGIVRALNNTYAMGGSRYRTGGSSGPSDTVYLGSFRTRDLRAIGGWNEDLPTNQDFELNRRMASRGTVWFEAELDVAYLPRTRLVDLARQYWRFGRWKTRYWRRTGDRPQPRQLVLVIAPPLAGAAVLLAARAGTARRTALGGVAAVAVLDVLGCRGGPSDPLARAAAMPALILIPSAWWLGLVRELVGGAEPGG
jgi:succinoglycan biosynthesis protein ExoA